MRKATAFRGRSEQDRSALVSRLLFLDFGNVPVERLQRDISFPKSTDTARRVPTDESYHYFVAEIQNVSRETFFVRDIPLKTFHRNIFKVAIQQAGNRAERSCSLRPRKAIAFLTHFLRAPNSTGAGNFAVCGRRLRGHVPSKNTSPTALSWISLTNQTTSFLSVPARCFLFL